MSGFFYMLDNYFPVYNQFNCIVLDDTTMASMKSGRTPPKYPIKKPFYRRSNTVIPRRR